MVHQISAVMPGDSVENWSISKFWDTVHMASTLATSLPVPLRFSHLIFYNKSLVFGLDRKQISLRSVLDVLSLFLELKV